jgi:hypothetical protein
MTDQFFEAVHQARQAAVKAVCPFISIFNRSDE